ncbi:stage II sporulation protein M, partial [Candidatus Pyrohabitans sp.]
MLSRAGQKLMWICTMIFLFSFVFGYSVDIPDRFKDLNNFNNLDIPHLNTYSLIINNLKVMLIIIFGSFSLGLFTISSIFWQGYILGLTLKAKGLTSSFLIIPHGLFEFPSIWLAGAAGLKGPQVFLRYLRGGEFVTRKDVKEYL